MLSAKPMQPLDLSLPGSHPARSPAALSPQSDSTSSLVPPSPAIAVQSPSPKVDEAYFPTTPTPANPNPAPMQPQPKEQVRIRLATPLPLLTLHPPFIYTFAFRF